VPIVFGISESLHLEESLDHSAGDVHASAAQDERIEPELRADRPTRRLNVRGMVSLCAHHWQCLRRITRHNENGVFEPIFDQYH
jgi:hypothetical protein